MKAHIQAPKDHNCDAALNMEEENIDIENEETELQNEWFETTWCPTQ